MVAFSFTRRSVFLVGSMVLVAITLISMGPQFGSLAADGDGDPEVPILASNPGEAASFVRTTDWDQETSIVFVMLSLFPAVVADDLGPIAREVVRYPSGSKRRGFELLPLLGNHPCTRTHRRSEPCGNPNGSLSFYRRQNSIASSQHPMRRRVRDS
jgi:hypothetical protein